MFVTEYQQFQNIMPNAFVKFQTMFAIILKFKFGWFNSLPSLGTRIAFPLTQGPRKPSWHYFVVTNSQILLSLAILIHK
jgi:hypothetical protein